MRKHSRFVLFLSVILILLALASCDSGPKGDSTHDAGEVALCDLNDDLIGWRVTSQGQISFIDLSPPDGIYFELDDAGCEVGAFAHNEFWLDFSDDQQAQMALENLVEIEGILTKEDGRMLISVQDLR